jgi:UTP--glucose-1-phosphate uridylyltransferase
MKIRKVVLPVAGLGTRFLPATKAVPKELLPVGDKPLVQYATDEALRAGITELIFITSRTKTAIQAHYDKAHELEAELTQKKKDELLRAVRSIVPEGVTCMFIDQPRALGLGHAVLCARAAVGDEPFAVILPDDLIDDGERGCLAQMVEAFGEHGHSMVAVESVHPEQTDRYGIVSVRGEGGRAERMKAIVEKPRPADAPSNLGVVGRYVFTPRLFEHLDRTAAGAGGEIQLTDAIAALIEEEPVFAFQFEGRRYDCGSKRGMVHATVAYALKDPELAAELGASYRDTLRMLTEE